MNYGVSSDVNYGVSSDVNYIRVMARGHGRARAPSLAVLGVFYHFVACLSIGVCKFVRQNIVFFLGY